MAGNHLPPWTIAEAEIEELLSKYSLQYLSAPCTQKPYACDYALYAYAFI
jgi:hypothetical protein